jgi:hypothetical protein
MVGGARPSPWPPDISACCAAASDETRNMRTFTGCNAPISAAISRPLLAGAVQML